MTLTRPFPTPLLPFLFGNQNRQMSASATAVQEALGSFYLGTTLASLQGGLVNDLLGALLCPLGPVGSTGEPARHEVGVAALDGFDLEHAALPLRRERSGHERHA